MSEQGATLNDLLGGNIPLKSNRDLVEPLIRKDRDFVAVALSSHIIPGQGFLRAFLDVVIGLQSERLDLMVGERVELGATEVRIRGCPPDLSDPDPSPPETAPARLRARHRARPTA